MSQELIYTSAATGLKPGSKGFCTVAITAGLPTGWIDRLEPLSAYRAVYPLGDPKSDRNPINFSHWRVAVAGKSKSVLSRVAFAGADYSGRSNKLAHHIMLEAAEQAAGGPAWMMLKAGLMRTTWAGAPQQFPAGPKLPAGDRGAGVCATWASVRGDAGWAGALAESFITEPAKPVYLIYSPGTDVLRLFDESLSLLPPAKRWDVTFSTFFTELPLNLSCAWRAVVSGTPAATEAMRLGPRAFVLDLTKPATTPPSGVFSDSARAGSGPVVAGTPIRAAGKSPKNPPATAPMGDPDDSGIVDVPIQSETVRTAAAVGSRKRLATSTSSSGLETEIPLGELVEDSEDLQPPRHIFVNRGVSRTVFVASIVGCLLLGAAGSFFTYSQVRKRYQTSADVIASAEQASIDSKKSVANAEAERDAFKKKSELAEQRAQAATETSSQLEGGYKSQITGLTKDKDDSSKRIDELQLKIDNLTKSATSLQNDKSDLANKLAGVQSELTSLKASGGIGQNGGNDNESAGQPPENASVIDERSTKILFLDKPGDTGGPHVEFPILAKCSNAKVLSLEWPNGKTEYTVVAEKKQYILSLSQDPVTPTKFSIQTTLPTGTVMATKDLFIIEVSDEQLKISQKETRNPSAIAASKAALAAVCDSAFMVTNVNGGKEHVWRISLNRRGAGPEKADYRNIFSSPLFPFSLSVKDIRVDGDFDGHNEFKDWRRPRGDRPGVFTCELSQKQEAEFGVNIKSISDKECQVEIDTTAFSNLLKKQSLADSEKTKAETAANKADEVLKKLKEGRAPGDKIATANEAKLSADSEKKTREDDANHLSSFVNEWRNKYDSLSHVLPLSLRIPNGVEVMRVEVGLPQLPQ